MAGTKRRGDDEGSIYQRTDGRWAASISLGYGPDGKRKRKTLYGNTRKEVAAKLVELQKAVQEGQSPTKDTVTVATLMTAWLAEVIKPSVRPRTYRSYEQLSRVHIVPHLGREKLTKVDARAIQAFLRHRGESGLSPRTVQYLRAVLRRAFGQAVKWDWIGRNVVLLTDPPKTEKAAPPTFRQEQAQALLKAFQGHRHENLLTVLLGLGLRLGEVLGLRWEDVDLNPESNGGTLTVMFQLQRLEGQYRLVPPKSKTSRRTLSLPSFVVTALEKERVRQNAWAAQIGPDVLLNELGLVFTTIGGLPLSEFYVRRSFYGLLEKVGLEKVRLHDLRHLCASLLLSQGVHPRVVMEILGHSQISLTMNTYSHVLPGATQAAAAAMENIFADDVP